MRALTRGLLYAESTVGTPEKQVGYMSEAQMRALTRGLLYEESAVGTGDNLRKAVNNLGNMVEGMTKEELEVVMGCILEVEDLETQVGYMSEAQMRALTRGLLYAESTVGTPEKEVGYMSQAQIRAMTMG